MLCMDDDVVHHQVSSTHWESIGILLSQPISVF
jgi:hypothetical protein